MLWHGSKYLWNRHDKEASVKDNYGWWNAEFFDSLTATHTWQSTVFKWICIQIYSSHPFFVKLLSLWVRYFFHILCAGKFITDIKYWILIIKKITKLYVENSFNFYFFVQFWKTWSRKSVNFPPRTPQILKKIRLSFQVVTLEISFLFR